MVVKFENKVGISPTSYGVVEGMNGYHIYHAEPAQKFNLPKGSYHFNFKFNINDPIPYPELLRALPETEKPGKNTKIRGIQFRPNVPGTAYIKADKGFIVIDSKFLEAPSYVLDFVFLHETGHFRYTEASEWKCDFYALKSMLEMGWNPSQVAVAKELLENGRRKAKIVNTLQQFEK